MALLIVLIVPSETALAQSKEALAARSTCEPLISAAVTSQINIDRQTFSADASSSWMCSQTFTSEEQASQSGLDVSAVVKGVRIGLLYSSDQQKRAEARTALCSGQMAQAEAAYRLLATEITRDAGMGRQYLACVRNVIESGKDLACYFEPVANDPRAFNLKVLYRPAGVRVGKFTSATLKGAAVDDGGNIFSKIKARQPQPFNPNRAVTNFSATVPVTRDGAGGGSFELSLDDGTDCVASLDAIPASIRVRVTAIGTSLSRTEGRQSYRIDDSRDCGSDTYARVKEETMPNEVVAVSGQDWRNQISTRSSNCPTDASGVTAVTADNQTKKITVSYGLRGCGYNNFLFGIRECRGSGWIDQYGFVRTRTVDNSKPQLASHTETFEFPSGRIEATQARFKQGLEPDFKLEDFEVTVDAKVPDPEAGASPIRQFTLRGFAKNINAPGTKYCEEWKSKGKSQYVAVMFSGNGLATVFQSDGSCEGYRIKGTKIVSDISGVSPEALCAQRVDSFSKLPAGTPSEKLTGNQVFGNALNCKP
ncbi:MAG: hypothetical protein ACK5JG_01780 [Pseudomonadota bacterium]